MSREILNLHQAAEHVHVDENELRHCAQRGEIEATERGGTWYFDHQTLDEWAQCNILAVTPRKLTATHQTMMNEQRRNNQQWLVSDLFVESAIDLSISAKAKAGILRDMADLAIRSGLVYDEEGLYKELEAREEMASTAIGGEVALLHPRTHDPYMFEQSFIAYGRSERAIFFGAPNAEGTRHFFVICSTNHEQHLHILARLAVLAHGTDLMQLLNEVTTADEVIKTIRDCEANFLQ